MEHVLQMHSDCVLKYDVEKQNNLMFQFLRYVIYQRSKYHYCIITSTKTFYNKLFFLTITLFS